MKKNALKFSLLLAVGFAIAIFSSCENKALEKEFVYCSEFADFETPCNTGDCWDDEICPRYQQIWKELFLKETGITENDFYKYVFLCGSGMSVSSIPGVTYWTNFNTRYQIRVGWAMVENWDYFIIQYESGDFLTKEDIESERTVQNYRERLADYFANPNILKFASLESAMAHLKVQTQIHNLCVSSIRFDLDTGDIILYAANSSADFTHSCDNLSIDARLNLITGEISVDEAYLCLD